MNIIATSKSNFEKTVKKCAVSPLKYVCRYAILNDLVVSVRCCSDANLALPALPSSVYRLQASG